MNAERLVRAALAEVDKGRGAVRGNGGAIPLGRRHAGRPLSLVGRVAALTGLHRDTVRAELQNAGRIPPKIRRNSTPGDAEALRVLATVRRLAE